MTNHQLSNKDFVIFVIFVCLYCTSGVKSEYEPGTPGGPWTDEEVEIVKQKVLILLSRDRDTMEEVFGRDAHGKNANNEPVTEMSLLRLSFHDCLTYDDLSGGCDGCLNWSGMGVPTPSPFPSENTYCEHQFPKIEKTDNNGLGRLVYYLEKMYTQPEWPPGAPVLPESLKSSGKSRADFWQFAVDVALEKTIERSNHGCRHDYYQRQQIPLLENDEKGFAYGVWKCKIKLNKPFKFKYGRKDCIPSATAEYPFITEKVEFHSNPHGNIDEILSDVKRQMKMPARDLIALISVHGMIHPFGDGSIGTKYTWIGSGPHLSNMYYKILSNKPTYDIRGSVGFDMKSNSDEGHNLLPYSVGDADGNPVPMWGLRVSCSDCWNTSQSWAGGPCHWRPTTNMSPDAPNREIVMTSCYGGLDKNGYRMNNENKTMCKKNKIAFTREGIQLGNPGPMGEAHSAHAGWSNMFALNFEAGMYKKFDIDEAAARGTGCEGINLQNPDEMWEDGWTGVNSVTTSRVNQCPTQRLREENDQPIYQVVEEFANDHDIWAEAFLDAWQRMQSTGYDDLKDGPQNSWLGYYSLLDMNADIGDDYEKFIEHYKPVVFTKENIDPFVCNHQGTNCESKVSEVYEIAGIPMEINGESCKNFMECNDPTHGDL